MNKISAIFQALTLILATTILGGLLAFFVFYVFEFRIPSGEWRPVNIDQNKAVQILGMAWPGAVYIRTSQGSVYSCEPTRCQLAATPQTLHAPVEETRYTAPPSPGEVSDSFAGPGPNPGLCSGQTNYLILKDGTVWTWSKVGCCEIGCLLNLVYPLGGMILGFVAGIVILVVRHRRRRRTMVTGV